MKEKETRVQDDARHFRGRAPRAFTLIELLVVITVIAVLMAVAAPTILGSVAASRLTSGGEILMGLFSDAQSRANSNNRPVEVRIYRVPTEEDQLSGVSGGSFRGVIFMEYYQPGEMDPRTAKNSSLVQLPRPLAIVRNSMHLLPSGIVISENAELSTLIANRPASMSGGGATVEAVLKNGNNYDSYSPPGTDYRAFVFYPEGTDLADGAKWHLTVTAQDEVNKAPNELRNFYTLQVDPLTGRLTSYRPSIQ